MEGPTPISALIHAATMVTAGIFMVARMSPLFELSSTALSFLLVIGATTALFTGLIDIVQNDIKRVIAYSTLSQLGYMTVALGVSMYGGAIFHLMTHAFFKALLFLGAGSVIIAMHHGQDMRYMGGLRKYMPITWLTMWAGSFALVAVPFTSGFYSKDAIIEAVGESHRWGAQYAYFCVMAGVLVTGLYTFRQMYLTFHGKERFTVVAVQRGEHETADSDVVDESVHVSDDSHEVEHHGGHRPGELHHPPRESPWVVTVPLILLAIPSLLAGYFTIGPMLYGNWFGGSIHVDEANDVLAALAPHFHGALAMGWEGFTRLPFWLMLGHPLPTAISAEHAAPLLCAGVIGFRALRLSEVRPGERLGLYGFGGSAHIAIQVAVHWGCEVYVFTRSEAHRALARQLGADWAGQAEDDPPGLLDSAVIFAPGGRLVLQALRALRKGGTISLAGITMSPIPELDYALLYQERTDRSVANSTRQDVLDLLRLAVEIPIRTEVNTFPLQQANQALQLLKQSRFDGAGVLTLS